MTAIRALLLFLLFAANPAQAQITAIYSSDAPQGETRVEVSASGDIRISSDDGEGGMMILGGETYLLSEGPGGTAQVMRATDFAAATNEQFAKLPQPPEGLKPPASHYEKRGEVTINGRKGTAYYLHIPGLETGEEPALVMSSDPALAPLGVAMAKMFEGALALMPSGAGDLYPFDAMLAILKTGTPLTYSGQKLVSVDRAPIPAERFVLPAPPMTTEQVRENVDARFTFPKDPPIEEQPPVP